MATFNYVGMTKDGKQLKGSVEAGNEAGALAILANQGVFPTSIEKVSGDSDSDVPNLPVHTTGSSESPFADPFAPSSVPPALTQFTANPSGKRRARSTWSSGAIVGWLVAICLVGAVVFLLKNHGGGSSISVPSLFASPYSVDYRQVSLQSSNQAAFETTIRGPAAQLAVILKGPEGEPEITTISKEDMIANCYVTKVPMRQPQAGTWTLLVKTIDPEKVVWQKDVPLSLNKLTITGVEPIFQLDEKLGHELTAIRLTVTKDGNLPVVFDNVSYTLDGEALSCYIRNGNISTMVALDQQNTVHVYCVCPILGFGERHVVKGKLFYGKDHKSLDFEKEIVVPAKGQ